MATLHIIGNGFDLAHGLHTSYWDYHQFLLDNGESWFINMMENYFGNMPSLDNHRQQGNILWSDLERALGEYDIDDIFDFLKDGHEEDLDHMMQYVGAIDAELQYHFVNLKQQFQETFSDWCRSIDVTQAKRKRIPHLDSNGLFLTFNYSDTLERVYGIPEANVLHIHGRSSKTNSELIVGHNNHASLRRNYEVGFLDMPEIMNTIATTVNGLLKDQQGIIQRHARFFNNLNQVDTVVVYGHSMAPVDLPYFKAVHNNVSPHARWHFSYFDYAECPKKKEIAHSLGIKLSANPYFQL